MCQSQQRALKEAGTPVTLKCRPTKCLKAFLKLKRCKMLSVSMFAVYEAVGLGTEGDLAGRIAAGQVQLQQKD